MSKYIILLMTVVLAVQVRTNVITNPYDIPDQITQQVEQLASLVQGSILAANNELSNSQAEFLTNSNNVIISGTENIQLEEETIKENVNQLKDLANGVDIKGCVDEREKLLNRLPYSYSTLLKQCVFQVNSQEAETKHSITYIIDVQFNTVQRYRVDIQKCNGNILCLQPILNQIELAKIRLPQNIAAEVTTFNEFLTSLKVTVQQCSDTHVSGYTSDASSIYQDMASCVNNILG